MCLAGDTVQHTIWNQTLEQTIDVDQYITDRLAYWLPDSASYLTYGNHGMQRLMIIIILFLLFYHILADSCCNYHLMHRRSIIKFISLSSVVWVSSRTALLIQLVRSRDCVRATGTPQGKIRLTKDVALSLVGICSASVVRC